MSEASFIDSRRTFEDVVGNTVLSRLEPVLRCECLDQIEMADLERGYHGCGRLLTVVCGPADFGGADA